MARRAPITEAENAASSEQRLIRRELDPEAEGTEANAAGLIQERIRALLPGLDEPNLACQSYLEADRTWQAEHEELIGAMDVPASLAWLEAEVEKLTGVPSEIEARTASREQLTREIFSAKCSGSEVRARIPGLHAAAPTRGERSSLTISRRRSARVKRHSNGVASCS